MVRSIFPSRSANNLIGRLDERPPVGHDERGPALQPGNEALDQERLGLRVERRTRFVQQDEVRTGEHGPRDGDPLPLTGRELLAALPDDRGKTFRKIRDEVVERREAGRLGDFGVLGRGPPVTDVLADRRVPEERLLLHDRNPAPELGKTKLPDVGAGPGDPAPVRIEAPQDQIRERGLPHPARPPPAR